MVKEYRVGVEIERVRKRDKWVGKRGREKEEEIEEFVSWMKWKKRLMIEKKYMEKEDGSKEVKKKER